MHISEGWGLWYGGVGHTHFHGKEANNEVGRCLFFGLTHIILSKTDRFFFLAAKVTTTDEMKHFKKYFSVFFSKLVLFIKKRNEKISFEVKKKKLFFVCCSGMMGCVMANYKKLIRGQNINRKEIKQMEESCQIFRPRKEENLFKVCYVQAIFLIY